MKIPIAILAILGMVFLYAPSYAEGLILLGLPSEYVSLSAEEQEAYDWALDIYDARYVAFSDIAASSSTLSSAKAAWWHFDESLDLPPAAVQEEVVSAVRSYIETGHGLLLTGFAPQYLNDLGLEDTPPTDIVRDPQTTANWGFTPRDSSHPVFSGFDGTVFTLSPGLSADNNICWWNNPEELEGTWLAQPEWGGQIAILAEYTHGRGRVLFAGTGAFEWHFTTGANDRRGNLEALTMNMIDHVSEPLPPGGLAAHWAFDEGEGLRSREQVSLRLDPISQHLGRVEWTAGIAEAALRFDGYSTWVEAPPLGIEELSDGLTIEAWVAMRAHPNEDAGIVSHYESSQSGFLLGVDRFSRLIAQAHTRGRTLQARSDSPMPVDKWTHLALVYRTGEGLAIFIDGRESGAVTFAENVPMPANASLFIGRSNEIRTVAAIFPLNVFAGLIDEVKIHERPLSAGEISATFDSAKPLPVADTGVPPSRFAADPHRPSFHPIPEGNWTNEPHGLIQWQGRYHLFNQKNPNGPYFYLQRWGHLVSDDLVHWENLPVAIDVDQGLPDWNGIWTGSTIPFGDGVAALYTSNGNAQTQSVAFSQDEMLLDWKEHTGNPVTGPIPPDVNDGQVAGFRDPWVWKDGDFYYIIVGSGVVDKRAFLPLYRTQDMVTWEYRGVFFESDDIESTGWMWEIPIFFEIAPGKWCLIINTLPQPAKPLYWIGSWENEKFIPDDPEPRLFDLSLKMLAPGAAKDDQGRWVSIGIATETRGAQAQKDAGWSHCFSLPRILSLEDGQLHQRPAPELERLRTNPRQADNLVVDGLTELPGIEGDELELHLEVDLKQAETFGLRLRESPGGEEVTILSYNPTSKTLMMNRSQSSLDDAVGKSPHSGPHDLQGENLHLRIFIDHSVITIFANDRSAMTSRVYPTRRDALGIRAFSTGGQAEILRMDAWDMTARKGNTWVLY